MLVVSDHAVLVIGVQVALTLLVVAVSIPVTRRLHDAVPSSIRAGVASGVGTLTWLAFVPFALGFGAISQAAGVDRGAWLFVAVAATAAVLMLVVLPALAQRRRRSASAKQRRPHRSWRSSRRSHLTDSSRPMTRRGRATGRIRHRRGPGPASPPTVPKHVDQVRAALADMPAEARQVMVLRDVEGRSPSEVRGALGLSAERERELLQRRARAGARPPGAILRRNGGSVVTDSSQAEDDLRCVEFVEVVTAYLDGAVDEEQRRRIDSHLAGCAGCTAALDQFRTTINLSGHLTAADVAGVEPLLRDRIEATVRLPRRK